MVSLVLFCIKCGKQMEQVLLDYIYKCPNCETQIAVAEEKQVIKPPPKKAE